MRSRIPITEADFAELTKPTLRLFLSVDLEHSTRLKQSRNGVISSWLQEVLVLIQDFPQLFQASLQTISREQERLLLELPPAWKILGDELIFVVEIDRSPTLPLWIEAFQMTLCQWNEEVREGPDNERGRLLVKGAAWLAGFPVMNTTFRIENGGQDYAGPSVDAGFRLGNFATPRRLAISVDLAWLLLRCKFPGALHFDGPVLIKGVAEETGYPSLWIEIGASDYVRHQAQLLGRGEQSKKAVEELCLAFIYEFGVPKHPPFFADEPECTSKPEEYDQDLTSAREWLRINVYLVEGVDEGVVPAPVAEQDAILRRLRGSTER